jgi:hypothetical protein
MGDWCGSVTRPQTKKKEVAGAERESGKTCLAQGRHPAKIINFFVMERYFFLTEAFSCDPFLWKYFFQLDQ